MNRVLLILFFLVGTLAQATSSFHVLDFAQIALKGHHPEWLNQARAVGLYTNTKTGQTASGIFVSPRYFLTTAEAATEVGCEDSVIQSGLIAETRKPKWEEFHSMKCVSIAAIDQTLKLALVEVDRAFPTPLPIDAQSFSFRDGGFRLMGYVGETYLAVSDKCTVTARSLAGQCTATSCCGRNASCAADETIWPAECFAEPGMKGAAAVIETNGRFSILGLHYGRLQVGTYAGPEGQTVHIGGGWRPPAVFASTQDFPRRFPDAWKLIELDLEDAQKRRTQR